MSTRYYQLQEPYTFLRPEIRGGHTHVGVWVNHGKSGTLVLRNEEVPGALRVFAGRPALTANYGGDAVGTVITEHMAMEPSACVISERGEVFTVEQVMAKRGERREGGRS